MSINNSSVALIPSSQYKDLISGVKLITREELNFIKILRQNGVNVYIKIDGNERVFYVTEKGIKDFFVNPINIFLLGIPISFILNITSNIVYDKYFTSPTSNTQLIIQKKEVETTVSYSQEGKKLTEGQIEELFNKSRELFFIDKDESKEHFFPPSVETPNSLYLEHTNKIVGWGKVELVNGALVVKNIIITDKDTKEKVESGHIKGVSPTAIVKQSECSICHKNFFDCEHISGEIYNGEKCVNHINETELINLNLVKEPVNPEALLKLPKNDTDNIKNKKIFR